MFVLVESADKNNQSVGENTVALKDVIARVKAKQEAKFQQRQADKAAAKKPEQDQPQGDGNVFEEDEINAMERAIDRNVKQSAKKV